MDTEKRIKQAIESHIKGEYDAAKQTYLSVLQEEPNNFNALNLLGVIYYTQKDLEKAELNIEKAIKIYEGSAEAFFNLGNVYRDRKKLTLAKENYKRAIKLNPLFISPYINLGNLHIQEQLYFEALEILQAGTEIDPNNIELKYNTAQVYYQKGSYEISLGILGEILNIDSQHYEGNYLIGSIFANQRKYDLAISHYNRAISARPKEEQLLLELSNLYLEAGRYNEAVISATKALDFSQNNNNLEFTLAQCHEKLGNADLALYFYKQIYKRNPDYPNLTGALLKNKYKLFDYTEIDSLLHEYQNKLDTSDNLGSPFIALGLTSDCEAQKKVSDIWVRSNKKNKMLQFDLRSNLIVKKNLPQNSKIRIGYVSPDFRMHSVGRLIAGVLEEHDRETFEIYCVDLSSKGKDQFYNRIQSAADHYIEGEKLSSGDIVNVMRSKNLDIAIDLAGHTAFSRPEIFSARIAPIQINFLGFPGTMGGDFMDYIVVDRVIADGCKPFSAGYSESPLILPGCFQPNDGQRYRPALRNADSGSDKIVLACFSRTEKISPQMLNCWARILLKYPNTVLWLLNPGDNAVKRFQEIMLSWGLSKERYEFFDNIGLNDYLDRMTLVDIFLDTYPFNAGTVASDALWCGVPLVTLSGTAFCSRMGASLLAELDCDQLIATNESDYLNIVSELLDKPEKMKQIREKLNGVDADHPLFNAKHFCRKFEAELARLVKP